jgi:hypothetical protein
MVVTTLINLLQLVSMTSGKEMGNVDASYSEEEFNNLVLEVFKELNPFSKWEPVFSKGW